MTNVITVAGRTAVLAVRHDLNAIRQLAARVIRMETRVIRMESGQVVASATASEILGELEEAVMTTSRTMAWSLGWPAGTVPADYVLGGVRAVLPGAIIDNARVVVRDGLIAEVSAVPAGSGAGGSAADLDGARAAVRARAHRRAQRRAREGAGAAAGRAPAVGLRGYLA